ncbi:hypothetical protein AVEN_80936-1 [Araneus ventricosus]|uniref:Thyroglobulin type-1 domain-containing protein n=1 Tax=Araneus ventricosus TaxID=182803 RepID=A0A4Y2GQF0_ARAVE|nr:hypothetical protein AVEN_80936-1 [Araneus ventricosus]
MMRILTCAVFLCLSSAVLCDYHYPGRRGVDCPTAREEMLKRPPGDWMIPRCNKDGSFQALQCFDNPGPDDCMCVGRNGAPFNLPRMGDNIETCICHIVSQDQYRIDKEYRTLKCNSSGYFNPLQCSMKTGKCWCVTKYGTVVAPPSVSRKWCDDVAHLY